MFWLLIRSWCFEQWEMCVSGQRDTEVKHKRSLDYFASFEVVSLLHVPVWKQQLLKFSGLFFSKCYFLSWVYKKILKVEDSIIISREFYGLGLNKWISASEGADYKLLGFWDNLYTSELPLKYRPCWYFLSINEDWHLQMMLNLYIAKSVSWSKPSVDLEMCCGFCALMQKVAVEGAVSEHRSCGCDTWCDSRAVALLSEGCCEDKRDL